jgi:hypothetical protein
MSDELKGLIPRSQYLVMQEAPTEYADSIEKLNKVVADMPRLYETEGLNGRHPLSLHYFLGGCDWYIAEWDRKDTFFGYAILNNDLEMSEWVYISKSEILGIEEALHKKGGALLATVMNLDLHCHYGTVEEALFQRDPKYFWNLNPAYPQQMRSRKYNGTY